MKLPMRYLPLLLILLTTSLHAEPDGMPLVTEGESIPVEKGNPAAFALTELTRTTLVNLAIELLDTTYRYGGSTPLTGLDCSGLVRHVYQEAAGLVLPRTSREMARGGEKVAKNTLRPGDLLFFARRPKEAVSHVGIYIGDDLFIHAASKGKKVKLDELSQHYYRTRLVDARRYLPQ